MRCNYRLLSPDMPADTGGGAATLPNPEHGVAPGRDEYDVETAKGVEEADASLTDLMVQSGEEVEKEKPKRKRGKGGKFEKATDDAVEEPKAEPSSESEDDEPNPAIEEAKAALLRDGTFDAADIANLSEEALLAKGEKAKKRQDDVDGKFRTNEANARQLAELKRTLGKPDSDTPAVTDQPDDIDAAIAKHLKDNLLDDDQGTLSKLLQQARKADREEITILQSTVYAMQDQAIRGEVTKDYPKLKDPEVYAQVRAKMDSLTGYDDRVDLMRDAAEIVLGRDMRESAERKAKVVRTQRDVSSEPSTERQSAGKPKPVADEDLTVDQLHDLSMQAAMDQDDKAYKKYIMLAQRKLNNP
jgi:hypothetical protein